MFKSFSIQTKVFFYFLALTLINQLVLTYCYIHKINNIFYMNIYTVYILAYSIYLSFVYLKHYEFVILVLLAIVFPVFYIYGFKTFNTYAFIILSIYLSFLNIFIITKMVNSIENFEIFSIPQFYISSGLLIFIFTISSSLLLMNFITSPNFKILDQFYTILSSNLTIFINLFYIKAFLCTKKMIS
jgi:hypothetical protein